MWASQNRYRGLVTFVSFFGDAFETVLPSNCAFLDFIWCNSLFESTLMWGKAGLEVWCPCGKEIHRRLSYLEVISIERLRKPGKNVCVGLKNR